MPIKFSAEVVSQEVFKKKIGEGVRNLIDRRFGGDAKACLAHYDKTGNGLDIRELTRLITDAGYDGKQAVQGGPGGLFSKVVSVRFAAEKMIEEMDTNGSGRVEMAELLEGGPLASAAEAMKTKCRGGIGQLTYWRVVA